MQLLIQDLTGDESAKATLAPDFEEPQSWCVRINRHVTGAGFHDAKDACDRGRRFLKIKAHSVAGNNPVLDQRMGELVTQPFKLPIAQGLIAKPNGFRLRPKRGGLAQKLM